MTKEKFHIKRAALPWRKAILTECGMSLKGIAVKSRDEALADMKRIGKTRTFSLYCFTCSQRVDPDLDVTDVVAVLLHELRNPPSGEAVSDLRFLVETALHGDPSVLSVKTHAEHDVNSNVVSINSARSKRK